MGGDDGVAAAQMLPLLGSQFRRLGQLTGVEVGLSTGRSDHRSLDDGGGVPWQYLS
jgi:hypothetical protein